MNDWAHHATAILGKAELKQLSERSNAPGLLQLVAHLSVLAATGAAIFTGLDTLPASINHRI